MNQVQEYDLIRDRLPELEHIVVDRRLTQPKKPHHMNASTIHFFLEGYLKEILVRMGITHLYEAEVSFQYIKPVTHEATKCGVRVSYDLVRCEDKPHRHKWVLGWDINARNSQGILVRTKPGHPLTLIGPCTDYADRHTTQRL